MREIKFRAWFGNALMPVSQVSFDRGEVRCFADSSRRLELILPIHGCDIEQFTGLRDKNGREIYEGDIVKVLTDRAPKYECFGRSRYDIKKIEARATIIFKYFQWRLDTKNDFNAKKIELRGRESDERRLTIREDLKDYDFFQENAWNREHNAHAYWCDIEVIGNIHENPELLK